MSCTNSAFGTCLITACAYAGNPPPQGIDGRWNAFRSDAEDAGAVEFDDDDAVLPAPEVLLVDGDALGGRRLTPVDSASDGTIDVRLQSIPRRAPAMETAKSDALHREMQVVRLHPPGFTKYNQRHAAR